MLTYATIAAGTPSAVAAYATHILEKTLPDDHLRIAEYYAQGHGVEEALADGMGAVPTLRADLDPALAKMLRVKAGGIVKEKHFRDILAGTFLPNAKTRYTDRTRISAMDLCLSAPKSVSVAWAFAKTNAERNSILQAHRDARDATLRYIEQEIATAGFGRGHAAGKERGRMAWITVDHFTARPTVNIVRADPKTGQMGTELYTVPASGRGDMQLHTHCIVPNIMITESGRTIAMNRDLMRGRKLEFGAIYQAHLAQNLRDIGVQVELCERTKMAKIPTIPDAVCDEFSKRTRDAKGAARREAKERGMDWDAMTDQQRVDFLKGGAKASRKSKTDDLANFEAWFKQAEDMGWKHESAITQAPAPVPDDHIDRAYETALPLFAERLEKNAVVYGCDARLQAARGLVAHGIKSGDDVGRVTKFMARVGVQQDDGWTNLIWSEANHENQVKITTGLHRDQEAELIELAKAAAADASRALSAAELAAAELTLDFEMTEEQRNALRIAAGGAFRAFIGNAGSGKTASVLKALTGAYRARGCTIWGTALAWRQAQALNDAGIDRLHTRALQPLLDGIEDGRTRLDHTHVVIIDEISQIGTRQLLRLLRLQEQYGFQIVATGDDRQNQAIDAGAVIDLLRNALGEQAIPQILTTIRQKTAREREITNLFRQNDVAAALDMKLEDKTAEVVEGGYEEAVQHVARLALERKATVTAPTNAEAYDIGAAIRALRQARGEVDWHTITKQATDNSGHVFNLALARGDRVRLFARTKAKFDKSTSYIGNNGSVLEVVKVDETGLHLKTANDKVGFVAWSALKDEKGRIRLTYGDCMTISSAQGITSDEHIWAMPSGSTGVTSFSGYVAASRHRLNSWLVTSKAAELREIADRRPMGTDKATSDADIWANVVRNLSRTPTKENATAMLAGLTEQARLARLAMQATLRTAETRRYRGHRPGTLRERLRNKWLAATGWWLPRNGATGPFSDAASLPPAAPPSPTLPVGQSPAAAPPGGA